MRELTDFFQEAIDIVREIYFESNNILIVRFANMDLKVSGDSKLLSSIVRQIKRHIGHKIGLLYIPDSHSGHLLVRIVDDRPVRRLE